MGLAPEPAPLALEPLPLVAPAAGGDGGGTEATVGAYPCHTGAGKRLMSCNAPGINCVAASIAAMSSVWVGPNIAAKCSRFPRADMGTCRGSLSCMKIVPVGPRNLWTNLLLHDLRRGDQGLHALPSVHQCI